MALHRRYRDTIEQAAALGAPGTTDALLPPAEPHDEVRDFFYAHHNQFEPLDSEAERTAETARQEARRAEQESAVAQRAAAQARAQQEDVVREADRVDPVVDHRAEDYQPTTDPRALKDPLAGADAEAEPSPEPVDAPAPTHRSDTRHD